MNISPEVHRISRYGIKKLHPMTPLILFPLILALAGSAAAERASESQTLGLVWVADSEKPNKEEWLLVINGRVGFKSLTGLQNYIGNLPKGSRLTWSPGCKRLGGEPLLSSEEAMNAFKAFCASRGVELVLVPSG